MANLPKVVREGPKINARMYVDRSTIVDRPGVLEFIQSTVSSDGQEIVKQEYERHICGPACEPTYFHYPTSPPSAMKTPIAVYHHMQRNYVPIFPPGIAREGVSYMRPRGPGPQHEIGIMTNPCEEVSSGPLFSETEVIVHSAPEQVVVRTAHVPVPVPVVVKPTEAIRRLSQTATPPVQEKEKKRRARPSLDRLGKSLENMFESIVTNALAKGNTRRRSRTRCFEEDDIKKQDEKDAYRDPKRRYQTRGRSGSYSQDNKDETDIRPQLEVLKDFLQNRDDTWSRRRGSVHRDDGLRGREKKQDQWKDQFLNNFDQNMFRRRDVMSDESGSRTRKGSGQDERKGGDRVGLQHLLAWVCRSLSNLTDCQGYPRSSSRDPRVQRSSARINGLIKDVVKLSTDVIEARRAIERSGLRGDDYTRHIVDAEAKLWLLIGLEAQLADELSNYRQYDSSYEDDQLFKRLLEAEDKIRRLIEVEQHLAREIGLWRKTAKSYDNMRSPKPNFYGPLSSKQPPKFYSKPEPSTPEFVFPAYRKAIVDTKPQHQSPLTQVSPQPRLFAYERRPDPRYSMAFAQLLPPPTPPAPVVTAKPASSSESTSSSLSKSTRPQQARAIQPSMPDAIPSPRVSPGYSVPPSFQLSEYNLASGRKKKKSTKKSKAKKSNKSKKKKKSNVSKKKNKRRK